MPSFDVVFRGPAEDFLTSLNQADRLAFFDALAILTEDPYADGVSKVLLNYFPYRPGVIGTEIRNCWVVYQILNAATFEIGTIQAIPDLPRGVANLDW